MLRAGGNPPRCARKAMDGHETFFAADGRTSTLFVSGASPHPRRTPGDASLDYSFLGSVRVSRDGSCSRVGTASISGALQMARATSSAAARFAVKKSGSASAGGRVSRLRGADGGRRQVNIARKKSFSFRGEGPAGRFFTPPSPPPPPRAPRVRRGTPSRRTAPWSSPGRARARVARWRRPSIAAWRVRRGRLRCRGP